MDDANWHIFVSYFFRRGSEQGYNNTFFVHHSHKITMKSMMAMRDTIMNQGKYDNVKILWFCRLDQEDKDV